MTTIIRLARPGDIPALIDLAAETFLDSFGDYHTPKNCQAFIDQAHNKDVYEVAIKSGSQYLLLPRMIMNLWLIYMPSQPHCRFRRS